MPDPVDADHRRIRGAQRKRRSRLALSDEQRAAIRDKDKQVKRDRRAKLNTAQLETKREKDRLYRQQRRHAERAQQLPPEPDHQLRDGLHGWGAAALTAPAHRAITADVPALAQRQLRTGLLSTSDTTQPRYDSVKLLRESLEASTGGEFSVKEIAMCASDALGLAILRCLTQQRKRVIVLGSPGEQWGGARGVSTALQQNHGPYAPLFEVVNVPAPQRGRGFLPSSTPSPSGSITEAMACFDEATGTNEVGCVVLELYTASIGCPVELTGWLDQTFARHVLRRCAEQDIPTILDDVLAGGGRVGTGFWTYQSYTHLVPSAIVFGKAFRVGGILESNASGLTRPLTRRDLDMVTFRAPLLDGEVSGRIAKWLWTAHQKPHMARPVALPLRLLNDTIADLAKGRNGAAHGSGLVWFISCSVPKNGRVSLPHMGSGYVRLTFPRDASVAYLQRFFTDAFGPPA